MAGPFEYKSPTAMVSPTTPTINVRVNDVAGEAFKSLQNMLSTTAKSYADQLKTDISTTEKALYVEGVNVINHLSSQYETDSFNIGLDSVKQGLLAGTALNEIDTVFGSLDPESQRDMVNFYNERRRSVYNNYEKYAKQAGKEEFKSGLSSTVPAFLAEPLEKRAELYNKNLAIALSRGISADDYAKQVVDNTSNYLFAGIDVEAVINNRDYSKINTMRIAIEDLLVIDSKNANKDYYKSAVDKITTLKNSVDSAVKSNIETSIQTGNQEEFVRLVEFGAQNGAFGAEDLAAYKAKFLDQATNENKAAERFAAKLFEETKGTVNISSRSNPKVRKHLKAMLDTRLREEMYGGNMDRNFLRINASQNPEEFKSVYNDVHSDAIGNIIQIAEVVPKTEAEQQDQIQRLKSGIENLRVVQNNSFGHSTVDQLLRGEVVAVLVNSGQIKNIPEAIRIMRSQGEIKEISTENKYVKKFKEDLSVDTYSSARKHFSVLVAAGVDEETAYSLVKEQYNYQSVDDNDFEFSGAAVEFLQSKGITGEAMEKFQTILLDPQYDMLSEEARASLQAVISGTNPTIQVVNNALFFKNAEGSTFPLPLNPKSWEILAKEINTKYQDDEQMTGVGVMVDDAASAISKTASESWDKVKSYLAVPTEFSKLTAESLLGQGGYLMETFTSWINRGNEFVDNIYVKDMSTEEAYKIFSKNVESDVNKFLDSFEIKDAEARKRVHDAVNERSKLVLETGDFSNPALLFTTIVDATLAEASIGSGGQPTMSLEEADAYLKENAPTWYDMSGRSEKQRVADAMSFKAQVEMSLPNPE
jgi:hypothetical protein